MKEVQMIQVEMDTDTPHGIRNHRGLAGGDTMIGHGGPERRWGIDLEVKQAQALPEQMRRSWRERLTVLN